MSYRTLVPALKRAETEWGKKREREDGYEWNFFQGRPEYYDLRGRPCTSGRFAELKMRRYHGDMKTWRVGNFRTASGVRLSTVWTGHDEGFGMYDGGRALMFETMIFGGRLDEQKFLWGSPDEAARGHRRLRRALVEFEHVPVPAKRGCRY